MESAEREYLAMAKACTSGSTPCTAKTSMLGPLAGCLGSDMLLSVILLRRAEIVYPLA
jgi:hypothetical protein